MEGALVHLAPLLTAVLASLSLSPEEVIETEPNGQLPADLDMALHIVLSSALEKLLFFLVWCLLSLVFSGGKGEKGKGKEKSQRGKKNAWTWKVTNTRSIVQFQQLFVIIALFSKVASSQFGTWSSLLWLMLTIFDSNKSITPLVSLGALL